MMTATTAQAAYIRSLVAKIEAREVKAPKKVSRWNDPVRAHQQHVAQAREILQHLDTGALTSGAASTHIRSLQLWAAK